MDQRRELSASHQIRRRTSYCYWLDWCTLSEDKAVHTSSLLNELEYEQLV